MKKVKKILLIIFVVLSINISSADYVENIDVLNDKNIEVSLSEGVSISEGEIDGEMRVLNDLEVNFVTKDFQDSNKILLALGSDLEEQSSYSLLSIFGVEGSIDFTLDEIIQGLEINNSEKLQEGQQGIVRVVLVDPRNLEVYFNNHIEESEFEFKVLKELKVNKLSYLENKLLVSLSGSLKPNNDYLLIAIYLNNYNGEKLLFDDGIYEFNTSEDLVSSLINHNQEEEIQGELNSAGEQQKSIEEVAIGLKRTPETGAETGILLIIALLINTGIFLKNRVLT